MPHRHERILHHHLLLHRHRLLSPNYYPPTVDPPPERPYFYTPPGSPGQTYGYEDPSPEPYYDPPPEKFDTGHHGPSPDRNKPLAVPQEAQTFHQALGSGYKFQYSQCTGRRKVSELRQSLIAGIDNWD